MTFAQHLTHVTAVAGKFSWTAFAGSVVFLGAGVSAWWAYRRDRRELKKLRDLSNETLRDFGLDRGDLADVDASWSPTADLSRLAEGRRRFAAA